MPTIVDTHQQRPFRGDEAMNKVTQLAGVFTVALLSFLADSAAGQGIGGPRPGQSGPSSYSPSRPTVSPYLNLFRRGANSTTNYHTLVRPQLQQYSANQQQSANIGALQQSVQAMQAQRPLSVPLVAPTGIGARFNDLSHFYGGAKK
jgi:hypothetical protein